MALPLSAPLLYGGKCAACAAGVGGVFSRWSSTTIFPPVVQGGVKAEQYDYYRLYDGDTIEAVSNTSFDESDSCLGRLDTLTIPPPPTVASWKDCLVPVEGVSGHDVQLLENEDGGYHKR
ncbi:hypothetical protein K443DRAFT_9179 [Laccaria amethystina LaAM-08-1]|uniref:Uncharacterized protein n=1 Tax=Laccaria amethystina LaAM-08-1 TaxID=1095629 RepID=A0A0C9XAJ3_9AGAR|nr:hypothetical protein K443DRAFT_9179 [Laccaria amethystina LaAM-08-1]